MPTRSAEMLSVHCRVHQARAAKAPSVEREYLSVNELATRWGVSHWVVRDLIKSGKILAIRVGSALRVHQQEIDRYVRANHVEPQDPLVVDRLRR